MLNTLKIETDKLKNHDMNKESNTLRNTYEPKYYEFYNLISDIISAKDSSLFSNKLTEDDYKTYNIETNPANILPALRPPQLPRHSPFRLHLRHH